MCDWKYKQLGNLIRNKITVDCQICDTHASFLDSYCLGKCIIILHSAQCKIVFF